MISQQQFDAVTAMFQQVSGIQLTTAKRALVTSRLQRLAQERGVPNVDDYVSELLHRNDPRELVHVVDKLTTNETYFFREPEHFEHLATLASRWALQRREVPPLFRVWSAASSSGEEAYSIAMVLREQLGPQGWEVLGSDLSTAMVANARRGLYPMERGRDIPSTYLKRHCLRGEGAYEGQFLVSRELRGLVRFNTANLIETLPDIGLFDVIFLRNVLIYFDGPRKADIVLRLIERLKPGGKLYTGHAESLNGMNLPLRSVQPAVYERA